MDSRLEEELKTLKRRRQNRQDDLNKAVRLIVPTRQKVVNLERQLTELDQHFARDSKRVQNEIDSLKEKLHAEESRQKHLFDEHEQGTATLKHDLTAHQDEVKRLELEKENCERDIRNIEAEMRKAESDIQKELGTKH